MVDGICFTSIAFGQTKTGTKIYAILSNKSNPEIKRLEAIWKRMDVASLPNQEPGWRKKRQKELKEAIKQSIKSNKKEYLPLILLMTLFC